MCQPSVRCTRVGPENAHANDGNFKGVLSICDSREEEEEEVQQPEEKNGISERSEKKKNLWQDERQKEGDSERLMTGCGSEPGGGGKSP